MQSKKTFKEIVIDNFYQNTTDFLYYSNTVFLGLAMGFAVSFMQILSSHQYIHLDDSMLTNIFGLFENSKIFFYLLIAFSIFVCIDALTKKNYKLSIISNFLIGYAKRGATLSITFGFSYLVVMLVYAVCMGYLLEWLQLFLLLFCLLSTKQIFLGVMIESHNICEQGCPNAFPIMILLATILIPLLFSITNAG